MDKITETYLATINDKNIINEFKEFVDLNIINESFFSWLGNFWKTSNGKEKKLLKTIMQFAKEYGFTTADNNPNILIKSEDKFNIFINIDPKEKATNIFSIVVKSIKTGKKILKSDDFTVKYSWTVDEIAEAINTFLLKVRIQLTKGTSSSKNVNNTKTNNSSYSNEPDDDYDDYDDEADRNPRYIEIGGYTRDEIVDLLNGMGGNKKTKLSKLKSFVSGWKKLSKDEQKLFSGLKNN